MDKVWILHNIGCFSKQQQRVCRAVLTLALFSGITPFVLRLSQQFWWNETRSAGDELPVQFLSLGISFIHLHVLIEHALEQGACEQWITQLEERNKVRVELQALVFHICTWGRVMRTWKDCTLSAVVEIYSQRLYFFWEGGYTAAVQAFICSSTFRP